MANPYFRFKQFTVHQDRCAMKVCTDACLFGAWLAATLCRGEKMPPRILDIGAGTGLLSLMLAQKCRQSRIDAVELDTEAATQSAENFRVSPWGSRLTVIPEPVQAFASNERKNYDLIISNPPFYLNDLKSEKPGRNVALHSTGLTFEELLIATGKLIATDGRLAVLLPYHRTREFISLALQKNFHAAAITYVKQSDRHPFFRSMILFVQTKVTATENEIAITGDGQTYTADFSNLLKDYYLYL